MNADRQNVVPKGVIKALSKAGASYKSGLKDKQMLLRIKEPSKNLIDIEQIKQIHKDSFYNNKKNAIVFTNQNQTVEEPRIVNVAIKKDPSHGSIQSSLGEGGAGSTYIQP